LPEDKDPEGNGCNYESDSNQAYDKAIELQPDHAGLWYNKGDALKAL